MRTFRAPAAIGLGSVAALIFGVMQGCAAAAPQPSVGRAEPGAPAVAPRQESPRAASIGDAERAFGESRYAVAEAGFRAHLAGAESLRAHVGLARLLMMTGRNASARQLLEAALASAPGDVELRTLWGESAWRSGAKPEAEQHLRELATQPEARRARVLLGEILLDRGRRAEAESVLMTLIEDYNQDRITAEDGVGLGLVGRAAQLLDSPHDANDAYNAAERAAPGDPRVLLWRAELFLDKHDPGHAEEVVGEVLARAPDHPEALAWMAHVKLEQTLDFESAKGLAERALAINPSLAHAHFVLGGIALRDLEFEAALASIERGLEHDATHLELLSLRAAVAFLAEDPASFEATRKRVFEHNPGFSRFYSIVGEYAEWEHRYDRIVEMMQQAVAIDDSDARAHAALGLNLIRAGQESAGLVSLRRAGAKDPFNVRVYNTLNLFEEIIVDQYVTRERGRFRIRYPKAEAELLDRYVPALLERAFEKMSSLYGFSPSVPIGIELYTEREHFAVRTSGLPETSISGVCFGKTLASLTPKSEPLNLGMTLWHELAHVFHIQMSDSHVPRWLTEGLAEHETLVERPEWRRYHDLELYRAFRTRRLPEVGSMNRAFSHAEDMQDMATAYYASSQVAGLLVERFGRPSLNRALAALSREPRPIKALEAALGVQAAELDRQFAASLEQSLARYRKQFVPLTARGELGVLLGRAEKQPGRAELWLELTLVALREREQALAESSLSKAQKLAPDSPDVRFLSARLAAARGQTERALAELRGLERDSDGYAVQMAIAELEGARKQIPALAVALEKAAAHDPSQSEPLVGLWQLAREAKDDTRELSALRRLAKLSAHDPAVQRRLVELLVAGKAFAEAVEFGAGAIHADLLGARTHVAYAQALAGVGRSADAEFEFESALVCPGDPAEKKSVHLDYAAYLRARGQGERAERQERLAEQAGAAAATP